MKRFIVAVVLSCCGVSLASAAEPSAKLRVEPVQWRFRSYRPYSYTPPANTYTQPAAAPAQQTFAAPSATQPAATAAAQPTATVAAPPAGSQPAVGGEQPYDGRYQTNYAPYNAPNNQQPRYGTYSNGYAEPYYTQQPYWPTQAPYYNGYSEPYYSQPMNPGPVGGYPTSNPNGGGGRTWYQFYGGEGYWY